MFGTVGGGEGNQAGDGAGSVIDAAYATVSGGFNNTASATLATVGGGQNNTVTVLVRASVADAVTPRVVVVRR
jgi:hypothetical protein